MYTDHWHQQYLDTHTSTSLSGPLCSRGCLVCIQHIHAQGFQMPPLHFGRALMRFVESYPNTASMLGGPKSFRLLYHGTLYTVAPTHTQMTLLRIFWEAETGEFAGVINKLPGVSNLDTSGIHVRFCWYFKFFLIMQSTLQQVLGTFARVVLRDALGCSDAFVWRSCS